VSLGGESVSDRERTIREALHRAVLRPGLRIDHLGDERVVLDPVSGVVHTLRGPAAKVLDALREGRPPSDTEPTAALVAAGIAAVPGLSRRDVLLAASFASALVVSATLPSAVAAASGPAFAVTGTGGELQQFTVSDGGATYALYRLAHDSVTVSTSIERAFIIGPFPRSVQLILVGAGGSGGLPDITDSNGYDTVLAGGGGGGEVVEVDLGSVPGGTEFVVSVAGTPDRGQSGVDSHVRIGATVIVEARGGGAGGSEASAAAAGGSGGGGASPSAFRTAGSVQQGTTSTSGAIAPSATRYLNQGGVGVAGAGGGGGGASVTGAAGSVTKGGDGGGGRSIEAFLLSYTSVDGAGNDPGDYPRVLGGGGGGAGSADGNTNRGLAGLGGGGRGGLAYSDEDGSYGFSANSGVLGTGGGGGGGASDGNASANPGFGGSGVAWVRMRTN